MEWDADIADFFDGGLGSGSVVQGGSCAWRAMGRTGRAAVVTTSRPADQSASARGTPWSILIPGPWVVETVTDRHVGQLAVAGH